MKLKQVHPTIILAVLLAYETGNHFSDSALIAQQATTIEQITATDERMERSRTNYDRPGITRDEVDMIEAVARDYGMPPELLYAMRRQENGGRGLYLGAVSIDPEIRKRYPPLWWQFAQGAKVWNQHINQDVLRDPYILRPTLQSFAGQWYQEDPYAWTNGVLTYLRTDKGLAVTEPPVKGGRRHKARGGGHRPLRHDKELSR